MTIQGVRDLVRPVVTYLFTLGFLGLIYLVGKDGVYNEDEKLLIAAVMVPLSNMLTYHFAKSSKIDSN